uniref:Putative secretory peptide-61 n=1 Tax=Pleurobrachia bachei TaxID=34499 RepID=M4H269_PLEBA|nr:putative secretory peptide-61 [Pleurobrachia bachei]|eukprot:sb/3475351/
MFRAGISLLLLLVMLHGTMATYDSRCEGSWETKLFECLDMVSHNSALSRARRAPHVRGQTSISPIYITSHPSLTNTPLSLSGYTPFYLIWCESNTDATISDSKIDNDIMVLNQINLTIHPARRLRES